MRKPIVAIAMALALLFIAPGALAVPASSGPVTEVQPDGTEISVRMYGDEHGVVYTDLDGNVVLADADSTWKYVLKSGDAFILGSAVTPGTAPAAEGDASYVLMSDLTEEDGQERMSALKKTLLTTSGADKAEEERSGGGWKVAAIVATTLILIAATVFFISKKRGANNANKRRMR